MDLVTSLKFEVAYANDVEQGKFTVRDPNEMPVGAAAVLSNLRDPEFVKRWAKETGIAGLEDDPTMHGGGLHVMSPGGWLNTHIDYAQHPKLRHMERRLNLIAFLNPTWEMRFGGQLLLTDPMGRTVCAVNPKPGRLVVFETSDESYHGVRQVTITAPHRVTVAVYYLAPIRAGVTRQRALFHTNRQSPMCPREVQ